jgi:hypothetical protein
MKTLLPAILILVTVTFVIADDAAGQADADPAGAFLRSMAVPGWGHFYTGTEHRTRGAAHLGTDLVLIGSIFGFHVRSINLREQYTTLSNLRAGVDISGRDRSFMLAVGDFNSLHEYNDYQLRTRNWDRLIEDRPENRWQWSSADDRRRYRELRSNRDRIRNQLPALAAFMVVNRVVSGVSAYNRTRQGGGADARAEIYLVPVGDDFGITGTAAVLSIRL